MTDQHSKLLPTVLCIAHYFLKAAPLSSVTLVCSALNTKVTLDTFYRTQKHIKTPGLHLNYYKTPIV